MPTLVQAAIWDVMTEVFKDVMLNGKDLESVSSQLKWQDRLKLLGEVVQIARQAFPPPPPGTSVLRVFLAPEYFFSEMCHRHVVNYETRGHIVAGLEKLSAVVPDVLLFPGTVSYFKPLFDKSLEKKRLKLDPAHASRLVKYAGLYTAGEEKSTYLAHNTAYVFHNGQQVFKYRKMQDCAELNTQDKEAKGASKVMVFASGNPVGLFTFSNAGTRVNIGMEICADHTYNRLVRGNASNLDLQVVLAASTTMIPASIAVREGGCVLLCSAHNYGTGGEAQRAWQLRSGTLVDLSTDTGTPPPATERIDPLTRPELRAFKSKIEKADKQYAARQRANLQPPTGPTPKSDASIHRAVTTYLQTRGGSVHFYQATLP